MTDSSPHSAGLFVGHWWTVFLRGLAAVAFGLLALAWPHLTLTTLVLLFGAYALIHGLFSLFAALGSREQSGRWLLAIEGVVGIWAALMTLRLPGTTAIVLIFFVRLWAIVTGVLRIGEAIRLRREISGEVWLALSGVVTIIFGFMLMLGPIVGVIGLARVIAGYALILGLLEIMLSFELRGAEHRLPTGA